METITYGENYPHTGVNCLKCGSLWLWGLSWDGSGKDFVCPNCETYHCAECDFKTDDKQKAEKHKQYCVRYADK